MSVKKEASGRRSIQVEVEVPGTPEEAWQASATGPGISSWFVPTEFEEKDGKPVAVKMNFGPGMESRAAENAEGTVFGTACLIRFYGQNRCGIEFIGPVRRCPPA